MSSLRRSLRRPGLLGALLVAATLTVSGALAYQAVRAAASHRAAVATALEHHARTAAWRFAREGRSWLGYGMGEAGNSLRREVEKHATTPGPELIQRVLAEKYCDCMTAAFGRTFVRVLPEGTTIDVIGEPLSERARDDLLVRMRALAAGVLPERGHSWRVLSPGTPRLNRGDDVVLLWRVDDSHHQARVVYGMVVERAQLQRPLIGALEGAQFFPSTIVPDSTAATLVRIRVAGANGVPVFTVGPAPDGLRGTDTLGVDYGGLVATASIAPAAARLLVGGALPPSRIVTILALLALALAMGGTATVLLRREVRLAALREDFVSGVSHELRTPLTQIRMLSELLERDGFKTPAERARAVGVIHRESLRLTNLVDNILEFSRLRRPRMSVDASVVPLAEVAQEVADTLGPLLDARGNRLEVVVSNGVHVRGDRDAVGRVLRNLVENAAKYGPSDQTIRMTLTAAEQPETARVVIDDEGPGIPVDERSRIWLPYYRLERDRSGLAGGSGLGLSVVADLVRLLGGTIAVSDAPQRGARFTIDLPAVT